jgi:hypothetical protein
MESVKVVFLCMANSQLLGVLWMVMSRNFSLLSSSCSAVKARFGCILLKSCRIMRSHHPGPTPPILTKVELIRT